MVAVGQRRGRATRALVGLRYIGVDTAFGDGLAPTLTDWLDALNALLTSP